MLLLLALASGTLSAFAEEDHVTEKAVLVDPDASFTIEQAVTGTFVPEPSILTGGYTKAAHWLRLDIRAADEGGELILRIRPTFLDEVTLFWQDPERPGEWSREQTGDRTPFHERGVAAVPLAFRIQPAPAGSTYYLRLETTSSSVLDVHAYEPVVAERLDRHFTVVMIFYLAIMLWVLLSAAGELVNGRDIALHWFLVSQPVYILYTLAITGMLTPFLPEALSYYVDEFTSVMVCLVALTSLLFHRALVLPFAPHFVARGMLNALILLDVIAVGFVLVGIPQPGLQLNAIVMMLVAPTLIFLAFSARRDALPGRTWLRIVYTGLTLALVFTNGHYLGLMKATQWSLESSLLMGLCSALAMFLLLYLRASARRRQIQEAKLQLSLAQQRLELQNDQMEMKRQFLAMLTHEIKTPLSVARLALVSMKGEGEPRRLIETAIDNMNDIVDRCSYADRLEHGQLRLHREPFDMEALLHEVAARSSEPERLELHPGAVAAVETDRALLEVLLDNLVDNALKYSPPQSPVAIRIEPGEDNGDRSVGIAVENWPAAALPDPDRLFDKYYRGPGAHRKSGSGLGLYIVQGIARLLGGAMAHEVVEGKVRFSLRLPC
ncbi:sensor histidine kinase [Kaistia defluvii]|uniref:histidine kinase n=1 Tax=Kaistia defluvii TaxID=410841 RepID=A0ABV2R0V4_9HYPH